MTSRVPCGTHTHTDNSTCYKAAVKLCMDFRNIGFPFVPAHQDTKKIQAHWDAAIAQHSVPNVADATDFVWDDARKLSAYSALVKENILSVGGLHRVPRAQRIINDVLYGVDEDFKELSGDALLNSFYVDHNKVLKLYKEDKIDDSTKLEQFEQVLLGYMCEMNFLTYIVSSNNQQSSVHLIKSSSDVFPAV